MSTATVEIISPILVNGEWVMAGRVDIPLETAQAFDRQGLVDIVSIDGATVVWPSCCTNGDHAH